LTLLPTSLLLSLIPMFSLNFRRYLYITLLNR
jgi:hypothetical protein